jgi:uncharacterized protein YecE (DUF72 family)
MEDFVDGQHSYPARLKPRPTYGSYNCTAMLRIGTSGWNYPTGKGTWNGVFYPPRKGRASSVKGFDELSYYAEHFDTVELNSSFYGPPRPEVSRAWVARTPSNFEFSLKLHQQFTHPKMYQKAALGDLPDPSPAALAELSRVTEADVSRFKEGLHPIASAQKLGALLVQFPASFHDTAANREYLAWLLRTFHEYPTAVELRHSTWSDTFGETLQLLNAFNAAWVQIDEPKFRFSIRQNYLPNVKGFAYMRLHGRNVANWWHHDHADDRYDYLYSKEELQPFAETAVATDAIVRKAYLYLNNHFSSKAVVNAAVLKSLVGQPVTGTYPPEMVERYPELKGLVEVAPVTVSRTFF